MKVLIKIKENIKVSDLNNQEFSLYRRSNSRKTDDYYIGILSKSANNYGLLEYKIRDLKEADGCVKRNYISKNIGITFVRHNQEVKECLSDYYLNMFKKMSSSQDIREMLDLILIKNTLYKDYLLSFEEENKLDKNEDYGEEIDFRLDSIQSLVDDIDDVYDEYDFLLNNDYFYLIDNLDNSYIVVDEVLHLFVKELYFVKYNDEIIISNELYSLKEYLVPIYRINSNHYEIENKSTFSSVISIFEKESEIIYEPVFYKKFNEVKFNDFNLKKRNYDISFEDFIDNLEFTEYRNVVLTYKLIQKLKDDSCKEYIYKEKHRENKDIYKGMVNSVRYISNHDYLTKEIVMDGPLVFCYVKNVDSLVIESLPTINNVFVFNEAILKIMIEMLYNVTDLNNIKDIFLSNKIIGSVVISNRVLENFPSLKECNQYLNALKSFNILEGIYNDESKKRHALDLKIKKERRVLVTTANYNINLYNNVINIMANKGPNLNESLSVKTSKNGEEYVIITHKHRTHEYVGDHFRGTNILCAPEVIDVKEDNLDLRGFVISFPNGVKEIKNLSVNGLLNVTVKKYYEIAKQKTGKEKHLFIVLPSTLDLDKFDFFEMIDMNHLIFVSDNMSFIEKFRFKRVEYNRLCQSDKYFNVPIVFDKNIYEKMWGYRFTSKTLYEDLSSRILLEQERIKKEIADNQIFRFVKLGDLDSISNTLKEKDVESYLNNLERNVLKAEYYIILNNLPFKFHKLVYKKMHQDKLVTEIVSEILLSNHNIVESVNKGNINLCITDLLKFVPVFAYLFNVGKSNFDAAKRKALKFLIKVFNDFVNSKVYFEVDDINNKYSLIHSNQQLISKCFGETKDEHNEIISVLEYDFHNVRYSMLEKQVNYIYVFNAILKNYELVRIINMGVSEENIDIILGELYKDSGKLFVLQYLYAFHILVKSKIYILFGETVSLDFLNKLINKYPYNEKIEKEIKELYLYHFESKLTLSF